MHGHSERHYDHSTVHFWRGWSLWEATERSMKGKDGVTQVTADMFTHLSLNQSLLRTCVYHKDYISSDSAGEKNGSSE